MPNTSFGGSNVAPADYIYYVYVHTSPSNKKYVGITKQNPERRWNYGFGYENNRYFFRAIKKYGWNNFKHEILYSGLSHVEALKIEVSLITKYDSFIHGYNMSPGGEGLPGHPLPIEAQNKAALTRSHAVDQYSLSGEYLAGYISISEASHITGVSSSDISSCVRCKRKFSGGYIWAYHDKEPYLLDNIPDYYDFTDTQNSIKKIPLKCNFHSICSTEMWKSKIVAIVQYNTNGDKIKEWNSVQEASTILNISNKGILGCLNGTKYTYKGFIWTYKDNPPIEYNKSKLLSKQRCVYQIDIRTKEIINTYESLYDAEQSTGVESGLISGACTQSRKTAGNYYWMYEDDQYELKERGTNSKQVRCIETGEIFCNARETDKKLNISYKSISQCCHGSISCTHGLHFEFVNSGD